MRSPRRNGSEAGFTILELMITIAVFAVVAQGFVIFLRNASKVSVSDRLKAEAYEHAVQMLEELRSLVLDDNVEVTVLMDPLYNDGRDALGNPILKYTLTTKSDVTKPGGTSAADYVTGAHRLSTNPVTKDGYTFVRNVEVTSDLNDEKIKKIRVRVWRARPNSGTASASTPTAASVLPIAEVFATVRSLAQGNAPAQVMDVYLVALESVPGWWSRTSNLIPLMRASLVSLQSRNPGLVLRPHWIRRMSYGRDLEYVPEVNNATEAAVNGALDRAYVYPGLITYSDGQDYYYLPSWFKARVNFDGVIQTASANNIDGYAIADQYNHVMRLPDEQRIYAIHQLVNLNRGAEAPEISLRMLLEKLNDTNDHDLDNSIVINLHGEMLPVVPLRNYSDAAKDPQYFWNTRSPKRAWRAVTHPEKLSYTAGSDVVLRTYLYDMQAGSYADPITSTVEDDLVNYVTLFMPDLDLSNLKEVDRMQGNSRVTYAWKRSTATAVTLTASLSSAWITYTAGVSISTYGDSNNIATASWWADVYSPPGRSPGLRVVFQGGTPTARAYINKPYLP